MTPKKSLTAKVISRVESYTGIQAGIVRLSDVLQGPSYQADTKGAAEVDRLDDGQVVSWPDIAQTVLVLGMHHPEEDLHLDYWERGDTWGNRRLREISKLLKQWLRDELGVAAYPLPYHVVKGGLFLKDAAVLSGLGIIGKNNLLLHPVWGSKIRLRSILMEGTFETTEVLSGFAPCETCAVFCQNTCPVQAFPDGKYYRPNCRKQLDLDWENKVPEGELGKNGRRNPVTIFCRACELSCPVGA